MFSEGDFKVIINKNTKVLKIVKNVYYDTGKLSETNKQYQKETGANVKRLSLIKDGTMREAKKKKLIEIQWICKKLYKNIYNTYILTIYKILHVFVTFLYKLFQDTQTALVKKKSLTE